MNLLKEKIKEIERPLLLPLEVIHFICVLAVISTPFVWMWFDWFLAWRIGLSGLIGGVVVYKIYNIVKRAIGEIVDKEIDKIKKRKLNTSILQEKIKKAMEEYRH